MNGTRLPQPVCAASLLRYHLPVHKERRVVTRQEHKGRCHCGAVRFEVRLTDGLSTARRCNCSLCRMRGAIAVTANVGDLNILQGADRLTTYQFNTRTAKHYFCSVCGIYTHHQRRSNSVEYGINAACLEGVSPFDFPDVVVYDGVQHPSDLKHATGPKVAGHLRFFAADAAG